VDASSNAGRGSTPIEAGYERLSERTEAAITQLTSIQITSGAVILADDQFFHPIHRTVSQDVAQCLLCALDHLRFLVWSLQSRNEPFPYAQASLMRTAITGAATALWMVSGETPLERRRRAMEFMFNDLRSRLSWMNTVASEPMHQQHPPSAWEAFERLRTELQHRLDWIVQQANTLLPPDPPFTRRTYGQQTTSDTDIVRAAGAMTPPSGSAVGTLSLSCSTRGRHSAVTPMRDRGRPHWVATSSSATRSRTRRREL